MACKSRPRRWSSSSSKQRSWTSSWCWSGPDWIPVSIYGIDTPVDLLTSGHSEIRAQYLFEKETSAERFPQYQDGTFWSNFKLGFFDYLSLLTDRSALATYSQHEYNLNFLSRFILSSCCGHFVSWLISHSVQLFIKRTEQCFSSNGVRAFLDFVEL